MPRGGFGFVVVAYDRRAVEDRERAMLVFCPREILGIGATVIDAARGATRRAPMRTALEVAENMVAVIASSIDR